MKTIQPVSVWLNGEVKTATKLLCSISYDNMASVARFTYFLQEVVTPPEGGTPVMDPTISSGTVTMDGQDYQDWDDSNEAAYQYIADTLNLVIVVPE
jgi:hypothetical protein